MEESQKATDHLTQDWEPNGKHTAMVEVIDSNGSNDGRKEESACDKPEGDDTGLCVEQETTSNQPLIYNILDKPPIHLLIFFAIQQCLVSIHAPLSCTALVAEVVCARDDNFIKTQILSATNMMVGIATILMTTIGVRLPIFQGPSPLYLLNFVAMASIKEWQCPDITQVFDPATNETVSYAIVGNGTLVPHRQVIFERIGTLSGSLIAAGCIHFLIGVTGLVGVISRYVGPITIVPPLMLVGLNFYSITVEFSERNWINAIVTSGTCIILALYLAKRQTPIPFWNRSGGFHIFWYPLHQVFAILFGLIAGWTVSVIQMSILGPAGSDSRGNTAEVLEKIDWFIFPYPGKFGSYSFNLNAFVNFMLITLLSVLDSIGDFNLSARISRVPLPPKFAFNRGLAVEGFMCAMSGFTGCCHTTMSYGSNIAVMSITRVVSLRVFQALGVIYIIFSLMGKIGAIFVTIPYSVIGGIQIISFGIYIGIVISYLQTLDLNSNRNVTILGVSMLLGFMMPHWVRKNPDGIQTGLAGLDDFINILLSNPAFVGGIVAFIFDSTIPGTLKERGLLSENQVVKDSDGSYNYRGRHIYRIPWVPDSIRRSFVAKIIPLFDKTVGIRKEDIKARQDETR